MPSVQRRPRSARGTGVPWSRGPSAGRGRHHHRHRGAPPSASRRHTLVLSDPEANPRRTPKVDWDVNGSGLGCRVRWPGDRPPLSQVLPIFDQLSLRLTDHRPEPAADTFFFTQLEDPFVGDVLPLLTEAFVAAWEGSVDRDVFASLVVEAQLHARQVQLVRAAFQYLRQARLGASRSYVRSILSAHREFVRHWVERSEEHT